MEILVRLGGLLSPYLFGILAGLSLIAAVLLFAAGRRNAADSQVKGGKLSELEPVEYRGTAYLILACGWSIVGLILGFIFGMMGIRVFWTPAVVILSLCCLILMLCFLCAGAGTLLHTVVGQEGGLVHRLLPCIQHVGSVVIRFGDLLAVAFFRQSWYSGVVTGSGGQGEAVEGTAMPAGAKAAADMERLQRKLAEYEALLTPEQREKLMKGRGIVEELRSMYS